jgi:hypothetical protein
MPLIDFTDKGMYCAAATFIFIPGSLLTGWLNPEQHLPAGWQKDI